MTVHCQQTTLKNSPGSSRAPSSPIPLGVLPSLPLGKWQWGSTCTARALRFHRCLQTKLYSRQGIKCYIVQTDGLFFHAAQRSKFSFNTQPFKSNTFKHLWGRINKQPGKTIRFCTSLGKAFKGSPTYKQIQTRPVSRGQTLQGINYKSGAKQRSEGTVVDMALGFLGVFKTPTFISHTLQVSLTLPGQCYTQHHSSPDIFFTHFLFTVSLLIHSHLLPSSGLLNLCLSSSSFCSHLLKHLTLFSLLFSGISSSLHIQRVFTLLNQSS